MLRTGFWWRVHTRWVFGAESGRDCPPSRGCSVRPPLPAQGKGSSMSHTAGRRPKAGHRTWNSGSTLDLGQGPSAHARMPLHAALLRTGLSLPVPVGEPSKVGEGRVRWSSAWSFWVSLRSTRKWDDADRMEAPGEAPGTNIKSGPHRSPLCPSAQVNDGK